MWVNSYGTHLIMSGYQSHKITTLTFILRKKKTNGTGMGFATRFRLSLINIVLSPRQNCLCVENKMTNNGPMWAPHRLKFQYRTRIGPLWALCLDSAHMGPICPCLLVCASLQICKLFRLTPFSILVSTCFKMI